MTNFTTDPQDIPADNAGQELELAPLTIDGQFVTMTGNHMVMTNTRGQRCSLTLARDASITRDGAECDSHELKAGNNIRVTVQPEDEGVALGIDVR
jgi:hypothetical protein